MASARGKIDELSEVELLSASQLKQLTIIVRDLCRDLSWVLDYQAEVLEANLATLPVPDGRFGGMSSRVRAKQVAWCLRAAADAVQHAGKNSVKCYALFVKHFVRAEQTKPKPKFEIDAA